MINENQFLNKLTIKNSIIAVLAVFLILALINECILIFYIHKMKGFYDQFSFKVSEMQNEIHQKIIEDGKKFDEESKEFERKSQDFHKMVEDNMNMTQNNLKEMEAEAMERNRKFNEEMEKLPQKLFAEHEAIGKQMEQSFFKEAKRNQQDFKKHILDVDKTINDTKNEFTHKKLNKSRDDLLLEKKLSSTFDNKREASL